MTKNSVAHTILFAVFTPLFVYSQNAYEADVSEVFLPISILFLFLLIFYIFLKLFKIPVFKISLSATLFVFLFFLFGPIISFTSDIISGSHVSVLVVSAAVIIIFLTGLYFIRQLKSEPSAFIIWLRNIALVLVVIQVVQGGYVLATRDYDQSADSKNEKVKIADNLTGPYPDIYYFILDGYGRHDVLESIYEYDNTSFREFLQDNGFYIADSSYANYAQTLLSVGSSMNYDYVQKLGDFYHLDHDRMPLAEKLWNNRLFDFLRSYGYRIVSFATGLNYTEFEDAESFLTPMVSLSQYQNILINYTPLPYIFDLQKDLYTMHRDRITYMFDKVTDLQNLDSPKFVFAHTIAPHPPFVFDEHGAAIEPDRTYSITDGNGYLQHGGTVEEYVSQYSDQVKYITELVTESITEILKQYDTVKPVIIIQGDHGPGSRTHWNLVNKTDMHERFAILNAFYFPDGADSMLYPSVSPVNSFRIVLNSYFEQQLEILPDSSFFSTFSYPYHFYNVTAETKK